MKKSFKRIIASALLMTGISVISNVPINAAAAGAPGAIASAPEQVIGKWYVAKSNIWARTTNWNLTKLPKGTKYKHVANMKRNGIWYAKILANNQICYIRLTDVGK